MTASREMPTNGDGADAQQRRDGGHRESFDLAQYDDSSAARRQAIECPPHAGSHDEVGFGIVPRNGRVCHDGHVAGANSLLPPLIPPHIYEDPDEPRFLVPQSLRNGTGRARRLQEGVLNKVQGIIDGRSKTSCEAIQPVCMSFEQSSQSVSCAGRA